MRKLFIRLSVFLFLLCQAALDSAASGIKNSQDIYRASFSFNFVETPVLKDSLKQVQRDSAKADTVYTHSYKKAMLWSAFIPGAGQIYNEFGYRKIPQKKNRAWWKVPIIYGLLGTGGYFFYDNLITAKYLKEEWIYRNENAGAHLYVEYDFWDDDELLSGTIVNGYEVAGFDAAAKRRDMLAFGLAIVWGLNIVEAIVDAHFVTFDVSSDLSLSWSPTLLNYSTPGVALKLNFN